MGQPLRNPLATRAELINAATGSVADALALRPMGDVGVRLRNAEAPWDEFSSDAYWLHNYAQLQPVDQEIIRRVSSFFLETVGARPPGQRRVERAIDVGSGTNLYPALLMLPWTK